LDIFEDFNGNVRCISFQTREMRNSFDAYPELILVDAMHKLNYLHIYVLENVDGDSHSEIICFWIMETPDFDTISFLTEKFKERNTKWPDIKVVMADKDMIERRVLIQKLPNASVLICLFHSMRIFKREVKAEVMGVLVDERNLAIQLFKEMALASSETEYNSMFERFKQAAPNCVVEYFVKSWHDVRHQWVEGLQNLTARFLNNTNNNLEFIQQRIKNVTSEYYTGITSFFHNLMKCVILLKNKRDFYAANLFLTIPLHPEKTSTSDHAIQKYEQYLTPFAFSYVEKQHASSNKINIIEQLNSSSVTVELKVLGNITVHIDSCPCKFFQSLMLPCKHIFAARRFFKLPMFDESLCSSRWTLRYLRATHVSQSAKKPIHKNELKCKKIFIQEQSSEEQSDALTELQKYKQSHAVMLSIAGLMSQQSQSDFDHNMQVLYTLKKCMQEERKVMGLLDAGLELIKGNSASFFKIFFMSVIII